MDPLSFKVPWPILAQGIEFTVIQKKLKNKKKTYILLMLKKSLSDPWPGEFGGRSKWNVDLLKRWKDFDGQGDIKMHVEAQFDCKYLKMNPMTKLPSSTLEQVREIIRDVFYAHC